MSRLLLSALFTLLTLPMAAQKLSDYQWQNRLILIFDEEIDSHAMQQQLANLTENPVELSERKLRIICFSKDSYMVQGDEEELRHLGNLPAILEPFEGFQVVLLGLDGGEKYRSGQVQQAEVFFQLIDQMPMRQLELHNKGQ